MPIYEYKCECEKTFDEMLSIKDRDNPVKCDCGKVAKRVITTGNLIGFDKYGRSKLD
jgi:putative FmdB family regulatory protein